MSDMIDNDEEREKRGIKEQRRLVSSCTLGGGMLGVVPIKHY